MRVSHKKLFIAIIGVLILLYGLWQSRDYLRGPGVYLESPKEGEVFEESLLKVRGQARYVAKFTLNGRAILIDEEGNFKEEILLAPGINEIEIYAEDKFGQQKRIRRTILLK